MSIDTDSFLTSNALRSTSSLASGRPLRRAGWLLTSIGTCLLLGGCIVVGGTSHRAPEPTAGQQLVDLKAALDSGAISPSEYESMRSRILAESSSVK